MGRITGSLDYSDLKNTDMILECVSENFELKKKIFGLIHKVAKPSAIITSNTSSISITKLAAAAGEGRADKFVGMHFFNPVPVMKLVEVIRGLQTSSAAFEAVLELTNRCGKTGVPCVDSPGFVCNRILVPMINEAIFVVFESVAAPAEVGILITCSASRVQTGVFLHF